MTQGNPEWFNQSSSLKLQSHILVVDDSIFFRQLATTTLESDGHCVTAAESAVRAVELLEHGQEFDLIVSDIEMPVMDGYKFAEWVRLRPVAGNVPMIALTTLNHPKQQARALQAGFNRYLKKFDTQEFLSVVQEFLTHQDSEILSGASA